MKSFTPDRAILAVSVALAMSLGACSSLPTYGTGKTAAAQTFDDLGSFVSLGGKKTEPIQYGERPSVVVPPSESAALPPPGSTEVAALAGEWPNDPDVADKKMAEEIQAAADSGQNLKFTMPEVEREAKPKGNPNDSAADLLRKEKMHSSLNADEQRKLFADAKLAKTGSVDENGNPVRRYLTEPPAEYRLPDPESPVEITEKKKGFQWPDLWPF